jgi:hypothetical protein
MNIETAIAQLTEAVKENTAALREILSVGAVTAADTLVPAAPKKRASKVEVLKISLDQPPLAVAEETPVHDIEPPESPEEPVVEETPEPEYVSPSVFTEPELVAEETPEVPDIPVAELRNSLKEVIKGKLLADTEGRVKATFDALRAKYGVAVIKELTDDQVGAFYAEVLTWG